MTTQMLVEDFLGGDVPPHSQLINGEVVVHDPSFRHQETLSDIHLLLKQWSLAAPGRGRAGIGGNWIFGPATSLIPMRGGFQPSRHPAWSASEVICRRLWPSRCARRQPGFVMPE